MKKVLLVEDHADIRRLVRLTLEFEACEIHEAADGAAGLAMAHELKPELILLDVMMPGSLNGLELCGLLRQTPAFAATQIILLTARGQSADREAGMNAGADEYLVKPFSPLELIARVSQRLEA